MVCVWRTFVLAISMSVGPEVAIRRSPLGRDRFAAFFAREKTFSGEAAAVILDGRQMSFSADQMRCDLTAPLLRGTFWGYQWVECPQPGYTPHPALRSHFD